MSLRLALISGVLALAAACGGLTATNELVDVGGHRLHISCLGEGSPTVVLEAGLDNDSRIWAKVEEQVGKDTRVCSYDRAGLGASDPVSETAPGPRTSQRAADELFALLANAGVQPPVVLVGHSYGGLVARLYAAQHPDDVAGLVLIDSLHPDNLDRVRELAGEVAYGLVIGRLSDGHEKVDLVVSLAEARASGDLGDLPLSVVTAGRTDLPPFLDAGFRQTLADAWLEAQRDLADLSTNSSHTIAQGAGHCVQCDDPGLVAGVILKMANDVRDSP